MLKKPKQKTKRTLLLIPQVGIFTLAFVVSHVLFPYIGINLVANIFPFLDAIAKVDTVGELMGAESGSLLRRKSREVRRSRLLRFSSC